MIAFVRHRRDDRGMIVAPFGQRDAGAFAQRRAAPLRADHQRRGDGLAIGERDARAGRVADARRSGGRACAGRSARPPARSRASAARSRRFSTMMPSGSSSAPGIEQDAARLEPVAHPDRADRAGLAGEPLRRRRSPPASARRSWRWRWRGRHSSARSASRDRPDRRRCWSGRGGPARWRGSARPGRRRG